MRNLFLLTYCRHRPMDARKRRCRILLATHCLMICVIQLWTLYNFGGTWRRTCSPDIWSVSALGVFLRNRALQIDIYLLTYLLTASEPVAYRLVYNIDYLARGRYLAYRPTEVRWLRHSSNSPCLSPCITATLTIDTELPTAVFDLSDSYSQSSVLQIHNNYAVRLPTKEPTIMWCDENDYSACSVFHHTLPA